MPSKYVPTGRPAGRPPKPQVEKLGIQDVVARFKDTTCDRHFTPLDAICPDCFPEGWGAYESRNCRHGTWVKRAG
jgi:hypothetical protein